MTTMSATLPAPDSPLAAALQMFNLLPSHTLHEERARKLWPDDAAHAELLAQPAVAQVLHRQRSEQLLQSLGADAAPVLSVDEHSMPLALAQTQLLAQVARLAGVALLGSHLRRLITRAQVTQARESLQPEVFEWAQQRAGDLHAGMSDAQLRPWIGADLNTSAQMLGTGLLAHAFGDAPAPVRLRAHWKLHPAADDGQLREASGMPARGARELCLALMKQMDSTWLSYFPATR